MSQFCKDVFKTTGLRRTPIREALLNLLSQVHQPLSHTDIISQKRMAEFDRVTIYRTLDTLQKAGLLHKILGADGIWRFCFHTIDSETNCGGNHIHFMCDNCHTMSCLPDQPLPWISEPAGAVIHSKQLVVRGLCALCNSKMKE